MLHSSNLRILLILCLSSVQLLYAQLPNDFYDQLVADGFDFPTTISFDQEGNLYVAEKTGQVWIIDSSGAKIDEPLIDIREEVTNWSDHGLMGFALDPNFRSNGFYYLLYAVDLHHLTYYGTDQYNVDSTTVWEPTIGRVSRYQADPASNFTKTIPGSRKILLGESLDKGIPLLYEFHGLGALVAANDGTLLISTGDATSNASVDIGGDSIGTFASRAIELGIIETDQDIGSYKSQYLGSYSGKILRIDAASGDGLASNPYFDAKNPRAPWSRIWASGFRNPYRIALKPETGSHYAADGDPGVIYVGDVGNGAWEELNLVTEGGQNFGWPIIEGVDLNWGFWINDAPQNQLAPNPLYQSGACDQPFFNFRELFVRKNYWNPVIPANPCSSDEQIAEGLYMRESLPLLSWSNARWNKPARAIQAVANPDHGEPRSMETTDPETEITSEAFAGYSSLAGVFYTVGAYPKEYHNTYFAVDFSGWIKTFRFDDQQKIRSVEPFHDQATDIIHLTSNPLNGNLYYINLKNQIRRITYGGNPPPEAILDADRYYGPSPLEVSFDASRSFDLNSSILSYQWDFGDGKGSTEMNPQHTFSANQNEVTSFTVSLTVTDSLGASSTQKKVISLNNTPPVVDIISFEDGDQYPIDATALLLLEAAVEDAEHDEKDLVYEWRIFLHHNDHFHPEPAIYDARSFTLLSPLGCQEELYWYRVEFMVSDPGGLSTALTQYVYPYCGESFAPEFQLQTSVQNQAVQLDWNQEGHENILFYQVQRSVDYFHFETLATIDAKTITKAAFKDLSPLLGNSFYRIKAVSEDRAFKYSNLSPVEYPKPSAIKVLPNPASAYYEILVKSVEQGRVEFRLFDLSGRQILNTTWNSPSGQAFSKRLLTSNLSNGAYFYQIKSGEQQTVGKMLIRK